MNKQTWPPFPLFWLDEKDRNMSALSTLSSHLHGKTEGFRNRERGFKGQATEMEQQLIRSISDLEQQVLHLNDVLQCSLAIIAEEHWRRTHKLERAFAWIKNIAKRVEQKLTQNVFYRILAIASTLTLLLVIGRFLYRLIYGH